MGQCQASPGPKSEACKRTSSGRLIERDLSAFERLSWKATPYASIAHWFQIDGPSTCQDVADALTKVHKLFAPLQATVQNKRFVVRPELEPEVVIDEAADVSLKGLAKLAGEEASRGMSDCWMTCEGRLLWRASVLAKGWVMMTFHHAIVDAKSIAMMMRSLLEILSGIEREPPKLTLEPKMTQLLDDPGSGQVTKFLEQRRGGRLPGITVGHIVNLIPSRKRSGNVQLREGREWPKPEATATWQARRTKVCTHSFDICSRLRDVCRERGLTVNTALVASLALALRRQMLKKGSVSMRPILAFDARRHIANSEELFGSYSLGGRFRSGLSGLNVGSDTDFWALANEAKQLVHDVGEIAEAHKISWYMRFLVSAMGKRGVSWLNGAMDLDGPDQGRTNALLVSNVGILKDLALGPFRISQTYFASHQAAWGPFVWMNASSIGERMFLTLCYVEPLLSDSNAERILAEVVMQLEDACAAVKRDTSLPVTLGQGGGPCKEI
eukprot:TRINITY_DN29425_c0_g1_i1.p1 TRINITY_DN29425_c0_g1~~TRINITY_DN29425_c0_g1_i1.p1  ORF type:complete len:498 (-),score=88.02 TRINITY_DN29425_c0_g1_i1:52-1545(-)